MLFRRNKSNGEGIFTFYSEHAKEILTDFKEAKAALKNGGKAKEQSSSLRRRNPLSFLFRFRKNMDEKKRDEKNMDKKNLDEEASLLGVSGGKRHQDQGRSRRQLQGRRQMLSGSRRRTRRNVADEGR